MNTNPKRLEVRPYQLMCIVCKLGSGRPPGAKDRKLSAILETIRRDPNVPVTLRCNVDSAYRYQNPGAEDDTPEGGLFNEKRDLDILQRLGLVPGSTRPAVELFERVFKEIKTPRGICGYEVTTAEGWKGCADADSGNYEKGIAKGVKAKDGVFMPRDEEEKARYKRESADVMYEADLLSIRPHHLMCMACFFGRRKTLAPIKEDNLFEGIDVIQKNPDVPVKLIRGTCMICPPCSAYDAASGLCRGGTGMNLRDQKKDLDVLQVLGLEYGDVLPGRQLYGLLFERIHSTTQICGYKDGIERGTEWSICSGPEGNKGYIKAREANLGID